MSINDETRRLARARRQELVDLGTATTVELARAWAETWDALEPEYERALQAILADIVDGQPVTTAHLERHELMRQSLAETRARLEELAAHADAALTRDVQRIISSQPPATLEQLRSQLPPGASGSRAQFAAVNPDALAALVARTTTRITSRSQPLTADMEQGMRRALLRGIGAGDSPRETARRIIQDTRGQFAGGLGRAMTIARTEQLDAARAADQLTMEANADVIAGWRWMAELDADTCMACAVMHGQLFPPDQFGPEGHPNCRCTSVTALKSWAELGLGEGAPEPPDVIYEGEGKDFFDSLDEESQRHMMGPGRYEAYQRGDFAWEDLAVRHENPDWRAAYYEVALKDLVSG